LSKVFSSAALVLTVAAMVGGGAEASQVRILQADTQAAFLTGTFDGVSVDALGTLRLADHVERLTAIAEPFVFGAVAVPDGWVVGTGNSGRVLHVDRAGKVAELYAAGEPEIFALWADPDGTVFAGSSPNGKVYRLKNGKAEVFFAPGETYIWALARAKDGALLVATGTAGKLYRVDGAGKGEVVYDSTDTHLRSLLPMADGSVLVGTAGEGLIVRLVPRDKGYLAQTAYDATQPEVAALARDPEGNAYAAVLASEASFVDLAKPAAADAKQAAGEAAANGGDQAAAGAADSEGEVSVVVEVSAAATPAGGSRPAGATGPRSLILRIAPNGVVETLWSFDAETVHALAWQGGRLWAATGLEGKLFSFDGTAMVLEADVEERQLVGLLPTAAAAASDPSRPPRAPVFASSNASALFVPDAAPRGSGTYTSPVLDAGQLARFGTLHWDGELPAGAAVAWSFRSGLAAEPDATWSPWTSATRSTPSAGGGHDQADIAVGDDLPRGRFVQWRAELLAGKGPGKGLATSPRVAAVELSFRQENLRPKIDGFAPLGPGQVLVPSGFNPGSQVYEPVSPDRDGFFEVLAPAPDADLGGRLKPLWRKGFRTLKWRASDANGDTLAYRLELAPEGGAGGWLTVAKELADDYYAFDATALPDGLYRFRLTASDRKSNVPADALEASQVSEPVLVDHSPPTVGRVTRQGDELRVPVGDAWSPLRSAEVSVDAGDWQPAAAADGLLDGRRETLVVRPGKDAHFVLVRLMDAAWNVVTVPVAGAEAP
jgi:hypothetical protein